AGVFCATIEDLMRCFSRDAKASVWGEAVLFPVEVNGELAREHVEELRGTLMMMTLFCCAGRHPLFDDAERCGAVKMPAVAGGFTDGAGPCVVLCVAGVDGCHSGRLLRKNSGYTAPK